MSPWVPNSVESGHAARIENKPLETAHQANPSSAQALPLLHIFW